MKWSKKLEGATVFYMLIDRDLQTMESALNTTAARNGKKLKLRVGAWVSSATAEAERVLRVEVVGARDKYIQNISQERKQARENARAERYKKIVELNERGETPSKIAEIFGLGRGRIWQILRERRKGYVKQPRDKEFREKLRRELEERKARIEKEKEDLKKTIIKMKSEGMPGREIALALGCSHQKIYSILKNAKKAED